jgi:Asp-tRNA(Asn)/Glu-tRNA(Gln) amidotransferase C subunit
MNKSQGGIMATTTFQKVLGNLSTNKNVKNLLTDFQKLSKELKQKGAKLNTRFSSEKNKTMKQARTQYKKILTIVGQSEKQLGKEVDKALNLIKKSAADVEKNLQYYRKKAVAQSEKVEKILKTAPKKAAAAGKTSKKKTSKKTVRKTTRKAV